MSIILRQYNSPDDFGLISNFLIRHYRSGNKDGNWLQPTWEYIHSHSSLDKSSLGKIGIWEDSGEIVGVVHYESRLGEAFFETHPQYAHIKPEMLNYAENNLYGTTSEGKRYLRAYINDFDAKFVRLVKSRHYEKDDTNARPISQCPIPHPFPSIILPARFKLKSLAEDNDLLKINRVLWRGFNHPGEPPVDEIEGRREMQSTPNFRTDLKIVIEAPNDNFVTFCGMWYEPTNRYAYVEPVATDPDFRRMGLGKAAVLEGVRRCGELGATIVYVGSDLEFYQALGFKQIYKCECWVIF